MKKAVICGKILMFDVGTCPHSLTDKAAAFEAVDGGSIPSGDTVKLWRQARCGNILREGENAGAEFN